VPVPFTELDSATVMTKEYALVAADSAIAANVYKPFELGAAKASFSADLHLVAPEFCDRSDTSSCRKRHCRFIQVQPGDPLVSEPGVPQALPDSVFQITVYVPNPAVIFANNPQSRELPVSTTRASGHADQLSSQSWLEVSIAQ
jgi:hypothetical protein